MKKAMAAASALGATAAVSSAASLAINFKGDRYSGEFGRDVSVSAFGVDASDWYVSPNHTAGAIDGGNDSGVIDGVSFAWEFSNDWAQSAAYSGATGIDEVSFGYLDDGATGANITITGLSAWLSANSVTAYTVTLVMGSGQGGGTFVDTPLYDEEGGSELHLYSVNAEAGASGGIQGYATSGELNSDTLYIDGQNRNGTARGSIAGVVITTIPEPSSTALLGLAGLGFILRRRK
ncbi:PEP-CTERM sorting domain-containing protein [Rubritalea halochordaticola]